MKIVTVVAGLVEQRREGGSRYLACQRSMAGAFPGRWEFPGGKPEPGETLGDALRRELEEELGIRAAIGEQVWRTRHDYPGGPSVDLFFFAVTEYTGEIENRVFERIDWVSAEEMRQMDFLEADRPLIDRLAAAHSG